MIIVCPSCQARYRFDEARLGERARARTRCGKCGASIEIENPAIGAMTLPPEDASPEPEPEPPAPAVAPAVFDDHTKTHRQVAMAAEAAAGNQTITGQDLHNMGVLDLPRDRRFSLAVIQGPATGQIYQIAKTRTTIGRSGCDFNINDPEASRQHAVVEVIGERVLLRDLDSTNGTFIEADKIQQAEMENHTEFRIGSHVLMLIVTEVD
jgi:predicted Zn finger-like uncharacterized protein